MWRDCGWDGSQGAAAATPRRRFRLLDAMILVAATATGCAVLLAVSRTEKHSPYDWCLELIGRDPGYDDIEKVMVLSELTMPIVAAVSLALVPIRLSSPRPRRRSSLASRGSRPGALAA